MVDLIGMFGIFRLRWPLQVDLLVYQIGFFKSYELTITTGSMAWRRCFSHQLMSYQDIDSIVLPTIS